MWATRADAVVDRADLAGPVQAWRGHHAGYVRLDRALRHDREVLLDTDDRVLTVVDTLNGTRAHTATLFWHLGPEVTVTLSGCAADLRWHDPTGLQQARLELPRELTWSAHRGETDPPLGWYSPRFGVRVPATTLVGVGEWSGVVTLRTDLRFPSFTPATTAARDATAATDRSVGVGRGDTL
jgi:hypothetical protein